MGREGRVDLKASKRSGGLWLVDLNDDDHYQIREAVLFGGGKEGTAGQTKKNFTDNRLRARQRDGSGNRITLFDERRPVWHGDRRAAN